MKTEKLLSKTRDDKETEWGGGETHTHTHTHRRYR